MILGVSVLGHHLAPSVAQSAGDAGLAGGHAPPTISDADRAATLGPNAGAPEVSASLATAQVNLGQAFVVFIRVIYDAGTEVSLPGALALGEDIEELRRTSTTRQRADGRWVRDFEVELIAWVVGTISIPSMEVSYAAGGRAQAIATQALTVQVSGLIGAGPEQPRSLAAPIEVMRPAYWNLIYMGAALSVVIALGLLLWLRRRRRKRLIRVAGSDFFEPNDAYSRLVELEASARLLGDDARQGWDELAEIARELLLSHHAIPLAWTTGEAAARLKASGIDDPLIDGVLVVCDLVKFADAPPTSEAAASSIAIAKAQSRHVAIDAVRLETTSVGNEPGVGEDAA